MMKNKYVKPEVEVLSVEQSCSLLRGSELDHPDAKQQDMVEDNLFNTDTKNIWAEEEEEE